MFAFISILTIIVALLLIFIVIIQNSKGGGLASGFASSNQVMGVRKTTDFLEKATWYLAGTMVVLCIVASFFIPRGNVKSGSDIDYQNAIPTENTAAPSFDAPFSVEGESESAPVSTPEE